MSYFLFKSEPGVYSFDDFLRDKETEWDGVTNPTAVKHLREMKAGTKWIFYHTGDERTAVGTGTVTSVDATDPKVPIVRVKVGQTAQKLPRASMSSKLRNYLRTRPSSRSAASRSSRSPRRSGSGSSPDLFAILPYFRIYYWI